MATKRQKEEIARERKIQANTKKSGAELSGILKTRKRTINGTIKEYTDQSNFSTSRAVRQKLFADLAKEYKELDLDIADWTTKSANKTAKDFWQYAKDDIPESAITTAPLKTFGAFSSRYVTDIIGTLNPSAIGSSVAMNAQIGGMMQTDIRVLQAAVSTTLAEAAVEGLTNSQMAARMQEKIVGKVGQFRFVDKAGRNWSADTYFGMLNRTLHSTTARQSYIATATSEAGFDLYQIEGGVTGSSVDNPSDPCDMWAGRIISMTGNTKGYPTYQDALDAGVFHPQCTHFVRAIMPSEIEAAKKEQKQERVLATELESE